MKILYMILIAASFGCSGALAAGSKGIRFWNLTSVTIAKFQMAPAGTSNFGANQCENDKDGTVNSDERLKITNIASGSYDVRLSDAKGRTCLVKNVKVEDGKVFSIEDADMKDCDK